MSEDEDIKLVRATLKGNLQAFEMLISKYQRPLFNLAYRLTGVREDSEDIVQAVFVKSFENLASFDPNHKFFSWIYRMTVNQAINLMRVRERGETLDESTVSMGTTPDQTYESAELSRQIDAALGDLTFDYRIAVVLRHFVDLSYAEIAQVLEISEKTVKSRLYSARQLLCLACQKRGVALNG